VAGIHVLLAVQDVDGRDKPGHERVSLFDNAERRGIPPLRVTSYAMLMLWFFNGNDRMRLPVAEK
jgi:hypothetical protein